MFNSEVVKTILCNFPIKYDKITLIQNLVNITYKIDYGREAFVLKIYKNRNFSEVKSEMLWLSLLSTQTSVGTARPILSCDGEYVKLYHDKYHQYPVTLTTWLNGDILPQTKRMPKHYQAIGGMTAILHQHTKTWTPLVDFNRPDISLKSILAMKGWNFLSNDEIRLAKICVNEINMVENELNQINDYGLIHSDLSFGNLLFRGLTPIPIDFDDCGFGFYYYDIAVVLAGAFSRDDYVDCYNSFFAGYGVDGLKVKDYITVLMIQRALSLILWAAGKDNQESLGQWDRIKKLREIRRTK